MIVHLYEDLGAECVQKLRGMFAFALYDERRSKLLVARDRFGKKPFYYFKGEREFVFASELRALVQHPAVPRNISPLSLKKYFAYCYIPAPRSIYENVWKLPAGHSLTFDLAICCPDCV